MSNRAERRRLERAHDKALSASRDDRGPKLAWQLATTVDGSIEQLQAAEQQLRTALIEELGDRIAGRPVALKVYRRDKVDGLLERFRVAGFGQTQAVREIPSWLETHPAGCVVVAFVEIPASEQEQS